MFVDYVPIEESPFNILPDEVVELILSYLDLKSLKSCLCVDRRFNKLISSSMMIMQHLPITIGRLKDTTNHDILKFNRRYKEINFEEIAASRWFKYLLKGLKKIGKDIAKVRFNDCQFPAYGVIDVLSSFPNVEELKIKATRGISIVHEKPVTPAMFPKLRKVELELVRNVSFVLSISQSHLTTFFLRCSNAWPYYS